MARSRPPRGPSSRKNKAKLQRCMCEALEERQMLTMLTDGDTFRYRTPDGNIGVVFVGGNAGSTQLELVGAEVNNTTGAFTLNNLPGTINGAAVNGGIQAAVVNNNYIFEVYVVKSDSSSYFAAEEYLAPGTNAVADTLAFSGSAGAINFNGLGITNRTNITTPSNTGPLLLGALTATTAALPLVPLTTGTAPAGTFPLLPNGGGGTINAGVVVANGNDFGNFLFGGTVLGTVSFSASVNEFYAGWLMAGSTYYGGTAFTVAGDCNAILSTGPIGTDNASLESPSLLNTDFTLSVGGRLGEISSSSDFLGSVNVAGSSTIPGADASVFGTVNEVEHRGGDGFPEGELGEAPVSENDTFTTPQILSVSSAGTATVNGSLNIDYARPTTDYVDYYGVSLLAGQTFTTQLTATSDLHVAVYDPDGVLIATDYNVTDSTFTTQQPFQITAAKPGLYRFEVAQAANPPFATTPAASVSGSYPYTLAVSNVGNVSFGGLISQTVVRTPDITDNSGDVGAVLAVGILRSESNTTFSILDGSLREAQGVSIGFVNGGLGISNGIGLDVTGSVGLLEAVTGVLFVTTSAPVGGNIQIISATGNSALLGLAVDGGIGVIRAANMATTTPSTIQVNADDTPNNDGIIDLIDVTGNFGTLGAGGPAIITGPGGDLRYLHVGGTVFQDSFFGGGTPTSTVYEAGQSVQIVDDSGSVVNLVPESGLIADATAASGFDTTPGTLTVTTYGIEGSGGSAIVNVTSTHGVTVTVDGNGPGQSAEIGTITVQGLGTALLPTPVSTTTTTGGTTTGANGGNGTSGSDGNGSTSIGGGGSSTGVDFPLPGQPGGAPIKTTVTGPTNTPVTLPALPELSTVAGSGPLDVVLNGNGDADVYSITGTDLTSIQNDTPGEIVGGSVTSVGNFTSDGTIGMPVGSFGEQVNGASTFSNTYPFNQQHYGFNTSGTNSGIISVKAPKIANLVGGTLGIATLTGAIDGVVQVNGPLGTANISSMAWEGSGAVALAGIFATKTIGTINASGDIRGDIISESGVQKIQLGGTASLIDAQIASYANFTSASPLTTSRTFLTTATNITNPILDIGSITVAGTGGIIGTFIAGSHIGNITSGGFGIFDSNITAVGNGTASTIAAAGYGIRFGVISGGANVGSIIAVGNGKTIPVTNYSADVRQSEGGGMFDPNTGLLFSPLNDIDTTLGASATVPEVAGVTDSGIIEDLSVMLSRGIGTISAYAIRERSITVNGVVFSVPSTFNVANGIGTLQTAGGISDTSITTGRITKFIANGDTSDDTIQVAGAIDSIVFKSNLDEGSSISVSGPNGHIGSLTIDGNLAGSISAHTYIQSIHVLGSISGTISAARIGTVRVHSGLGDGGLAVTGPIANLIFDGDGGSIGNTITINGNSSVVKVAGNLAASLNVTGNLGQLLVGGSILSGSTVTIGNVLNLLKLGADLQAGATVSAHLIRRQMIKGQILGNIVIT